MKPKPQLEQLVNAQEQEAQLEILAQESELQRDATYREDGDLSKMLDIPREVDGLVKLVEEKKGIEDSVPEIEKRNYRPEPSAANTLLTLTSGSVPGFTLFLYGLLHNSYDSVFLGWVAAMIGSVGAHTINYQYNINISPARKKFDQEKAENLQTKQIELQTLNKKLSHYEKHYTLNDIVLVNDAELGYSLGDIRYNSREEKVLHQAYHKLIRNVPEALDGRYWKECEEYKPIDENAIISVLKPSSESLSVDDLRYLEEGTPVLCVSMAEKPKYHSPVYGFIDNKRTDDIFIFHTLRTFQGPGEYWHKFDQVEKGEISVHILTPMIKSRIF